jgi:hypothetical protein
VDDLRDLVVNIVAGVLLFVLGFGSRQGYAIWQGRKVGRFWRPITRGGVTLVIGRFEEKFRNYDPVGFHGRGDTEARRELNDMFRDARLRPLSLTEPATISSVGRRGNLILLGGGDGNPLAARLMADVGSRIQFLNEDEVSPPALLDNANNPPFRMQPEVRDGQTLTDFGVLIRARNPSDRRKWVVIIAGCYGFATWVGPRLTQDPMLANAPDEFECVYRVPINENEPGEPEIFIGLRPLPRH